MYSDSQAGRFLRQTNHTGTACTTRKSVLPSREASRDQTDIPSQADNKSVRPHLLKWRMANEINPGCTIQLYLRIDALQEKSFLRSEISFMIKNTHLFNPYQRRAVTLQNRSLRRRFANYSAEDGLSMIGTSSSRGDVRWMVRALCPQRRIRRQRQTRLF